jgi:hypothetical protein
LSQKLDEAIRDPWAGDPWASLDMTREEALATYEGLLQQFGKKGDLYYVINIKEGTCSCPDCCRYHMVCKHLFAVFRQFPQWSFSDLPTSFTGTAHMILDTHVTRRYPPGNGSPPSSHKHHPDCKSTAAAAAKGLCGKAATD